MATFRNLLTENLYGGGPSFPDGQSYPFDLDPLGGSTLLMTWRSRSVNVPATPEGWAQLVESKPYMVSGPYPEAFFWAFRLDDPLEDVSTFISAPAGPRQFSLHVQQFESLVVQVIALDLEEGEDVADQWSLGMAYNPPLNGPIDLAEPSADGQTFVLANFDVFLPS